jgi:hypothetical protein
MRNTANVTNGKPIAVWSQSISGVSVVNSFSHLIQHPYKKGRCAMLLFCPGHHKRQNEKYEGIKRTFSFIKSQLKIMYIAKNTLSSGQKGGFPISPYLEMFFFYTE